MTVCRLCWILWLLASGIAHAAPDERDAVVAEVLALPDTEARLELATERMLEAAGAGDAGARDRWGAVRVVVDELRTSPDAVLSTYLTWALSPAEDDRRRAIEGARAGGHLDADGAPIVPTTTVPISEVPLGAPGPDHVQYGAWSTYRDQRFRLVCTSTAQEGLELRLATGGYQGFPTWGFQRGDGEIVVGWAVRRVLLDEGVTEARDDTCHAKDPLLKCYTLEQARVLVERHNTRLRERLGLHEDQVASLSADVADLSRCTPGSRRRTRLEERSGPRSLGDEPPE